MNPGTNSCESGRRGAVACAGEAATDETTDIGESCTKVAELLQAVPETSPNASCNIFKDRNASPSSAFFLGGVAGATETVLSSPEDGTSSATCAVHDFTASMTSRTARSVLEPELLRHGCA